MSDKEKSATVVREEDANDDSDGLESVASINNDKVDQGPMKFAQSFPTDASGCVMEGLVLEMSRYLGKEPTSERGMIFTMATNSGLREVLFAKSEAWRAKGSREEVVVQRGLTGLDNLHPVVVGGINFHHWLFDQSKSIVIQHSDYFGDEINLRRQGLSWTHAFEIDGRKFVWQREKESNETGDNSSGKFWRRQNLQCVDEEGNVYATYARERGLCCSRGRQIGRFEVVMSGLSGNFVETLVMTLVAIYVKMQKRMIQASQAGYAGGLVAALLYIIGG